jgi:hypothetical protein
MQSVGFTMPDFIGALSARFDFHTPHFLRFVLSLLLVVRGKRNRVLL